MARLWKGVFVSLWCCIWLSSLAWSLRCFSCEGLIDTKCESDTTEIECPSNEQVHDSCYTVKRTMDYPIIGRRVEVLKNCSVLAHCSFLETLICDNSYGFINSCSIQCCTGDLCNNKTFQYSTTSVKPTNFGTVETRVNVTRGVMSNNSTRMSDDTSKITMTSSVSSMRNSMSSEKALTSGTSATTSWTSQESQVVIFSSARPAIEATVEVTEVSGDATRICVKLPVVMLMTVLVSGINYHTQTRF